MNNNEGCRNINHILKKSYSVDGRNVLTMDVEKLTKLSARLSIEVGPTTKLYVFCRTDESKVYELAFNELGFEEI